MPKPAAIPTNPASVQSDWNQYSSLRELQRKLNSIKALNGETVSFTTPAAPNTDFSVTHTLGRIPTGFFIVRQGAAVQIYDGSVPWTKTTVSLKATVASVPVTVYLF